MWLDQSGGGEGMEVYIKSESDRMIPVGFWIETAYAIC
jgi:hypothetical protein